MNHSPAPWSVGVHPLGLDSLDRTVLDANGESVIEHCNCTYETEVASVAEPDLRLMAAAPELKDQVERFIAAAEDAGWHKSETEEAIALLKRIEGKDEPDAEAGTCVVS